MFNIANNTRNIRTADEASLFSHSDLKQIKTGQIKFLGIGDRTLAVTWDENQQEFHATEQNRSLRNSIYETCSYCCCSSQAAKVARALNQGEQQDKMSRLAERHDPAGGRLYDLVKNLPNPNQATLQIMRAEQEEKLTPAGNTNLPSAASQANPPRVLLYGFAHHRAPLAAYAIHQFNLQERAVIETIDDYNACLNIASQNLNFLSYCEIYDQAQDNVGHALQQRIIPNLSTEDTIRSLNEQMQTIGMNPLAATSNQQQVVAWANHLEAHAGQFDFSRKLGTSDTSIEALRFIIKNCTSQELEFLNEPNFPQITAGNSYTLDEAAMHSASQRLSRVVSCLRSMSEDEYQLLSENEKILIDTVTRNAFFRQTSKLGLSFAKETGVMVLFSWKGDLNGDPMTFANLRAQLNAKPYKFNQPTSRNDGVHEFVTYSEMRQIGRLLQKVIDPEQPTNPIQTQAPDYLLVTEHAVLS